MSRSGHAHINPRMLEWARIEAGMDIESAANRIDVPIEDLKDCEAGNAFLSVAKFREAARLYRRPAAAFYLDRIPSKLQMPIFRRLPENEGTPLTPELLLEVRRIIEKRDLAIQLAEYGSEYAWQFLGSIKSSSDPEEVGMNLRGVLNIPEDFPKKKMERYKSFNYWRSKIEQTGVLVFQVTRVDIGEMRGLSIAKKPYPTLAVNRKDPPEARVFSLLHEFCHMILGKSTMCDVGNHHEDEIFCNHVAGAALVPEVKLQSMVSARKHEPSEEWNENELHQLSSFFGVSREVILRRLLILGKTSPEFYGYKRKKWQHEREGRKPTGFGEKGYQKTLRTEGSTFVKIVLNAHENKAITSNDLSRILGMKLRHLPGLEKLVYEKG